MNDYLSLSKQLCFIKDNDVWYIDEPRWIGPRGNLAMVAGADTLLEYLHEFPKMYIDVICSDYPIPDLEETGCGWFHAERTEYHLSGSTYDVKGLPQYNTPFWICPVTLFVLHQYPEYLYIHPSHGCKNDLL